MCYKSGKRKSRRCFKLVGVEFFLHFVHFYVVGALSALHRPQEQHTDEPGKLKFKGTQRGGRREEEKERLLLRLAESTPLQMRTYNARGAG